MEELFQLMDEFERRNNISIFLNLFSDGTGQVLEFWDDDVVFTFESTTQLQKFLKEGRLKLKNGLSVKPVQVINIEIFKNITQS